MEETDYVLVSRREKRQIKKAEKVLKLLGIDVEFLRSLRGLENAVNAEMKSLNEAFDGFKDEVRETLKEVNPNSTKEELLKHIDEKLLVIQENVYKSNKEVMGNINNTFKSIFSGGHKINEDH